MAARTEFRTSPPVPDTSGTEFRDIFLPNLVVFIKGFLEAYLVVRKKNEDSAAINKKTAIRTLIKEANNATSLKHWTSTITEDGTSGILEILDTMIENELKTLTRPGLSNRFYSLATSLVKQTIGEDQQIYLIACLGARSYACHELYEKNPEWVQSLDNKYAICQENQEKIRANLGKLDVDKVSRAHVTKWRNERHDLLRSLSKVYYREALITATEEKLLDITNVLDHIPKSNSDFHECNQLEFYREAIKYVGIPACEAVFSAKDKTFEDFSIFVVATHRLKGTLPRKLSDSESKSLPPASVTTPPIPDTRSPVSSIAKTTSTLFSTANPDNADNLNEEPKTAVVSRAAPRTVVNRRS